MAEVGRKFKTKLTILGMDVEYEGRGKKPPHTPYTIYNVTALGEDGVPVEERLRTFDGDLPRNELIEVDVEERKDERHGDTFTISLVGKAKQRGAGLAGSVDELREQLEALERRVVLLENPQLQSHATPPPGAAPTF